MLKLTAIFSLLLIATWSHADSRRYKKEASDPRDIGSGSTMWAASLSCDSCGSECASACGTRHFRSCCFNYLRKKRGPSDGLKFISSAAHDIKSLPENLQKSEKRRFPVFRVESIPEQWMSNIIASEYGPYLYEDTLENRLFDV